MKKILVLLLLASNCLIYGKEVLYIIQPYGWQSHNVELFSESESALNSFLDIDEEYLTFKKDITEIDQSNLLLSFSNDRFEVTLDKNLLENNPLSINENEYRIDIRNKNVLFILKNDLLGDYLVYKSKIIFFTTKDDLIYAPYNLQVLKSDITDFEFLLDYLMFSSSLLANIDLVDIEKSSYSTGEVLGYSDSNIGISFYNPFYDFNILPILITDSKL